MDDFELRERTIDTFDVYDLVELLGLTVEDFVDTFGILDNQAWRNQIIQKIY